MLFKTPGKPKHEYQPPLPPKPLLLEHNQRSVITFNASYTNLHTPANLQRPARVPEPRFANYKAQTPVLKTEPSNYFEDSRVRYTSMYGNQVQGATELVRTTTTFENNSSIFVEDYEALKLKRDRSELLERARQAETELATRDNLTRGKQREIQELRKPANYLQGGNPSYLENLADTKAEKQKLYYQVIELQAQLHSLHEKYDRLKMENSNLTFKFDGLSNKSSHEHLRKTNKQQLLESELMLSQKRSQRIKAQYEKQISVLKQRIKEFEEESTKYSNKSSVSNFINNSSEVVQTLSRNLQENNNIKAELQKLKAQIKQKNEMIRYLQLQCLREAQRDKNVPDAAKINSLYEQSRKQIANLTKESDVLKKENSFVTANLRKFQKINEQYKKQIKDLEFLVKQAKQKQSKTIEELKNSRKKESQLVAGYESRIKHLQSNNNRAAEAQMGINKQTQEIREKFEAALNLEKQKKFFELNLKNQQLAQLEKHNKQLMAKLISFQSKDQSKLAQAEAQYKAMYELLRRQADDTRASLESKEGELASALEVIKQLQDQATLYKKSSLLKQEALNRRLSESEKQNQYYAETVANLREQAKAAHEAYQYEMSRVADQFQQHRQHQEVSQIKIKYLNEIQKLNVQIQKHAEKIQEQQEKAQTLYDQIVHLKEQKSQYIVQIQKISDELKSERANLLTMQSQKQQLQVELTQLVTKFDRIQKIVKITTQQLEDKNNQIADLSDKFESNQANLHQLQLQIEEQKLAREQVCREYQQLLQDINNKQEAGLVDIKEEAHEVSAYDGGERQQELIKVNKELLVKQEIISELSKALTQVQDQLTSVLGSHQKLKSYACSLQKSLNQAQLNEKKMLSELQQKQKIWQTLSQTQTKLFHTQTELLVTSQQNKALRRMNHEKQSQNQEQRQSIDEKDRYNQQIEMQLEELTNQMFELKSRLEEMSGQQRSQGEIQEQPTQRTLQMSKTSALSNQSFIGDFIEVDKNALLHICDLLGVEPGEGQILRTIIEALSVSSCLNVEKSYKQILELFGVDTELNEYTQQRLMVQIKQFRITVSGLLDKVTYLEARDNTLAKENQKLAKQITRLEAAPYQEMIDELNEVIVKKNMEELSRILQQKNDAYSQQSELTGE